MLDKNWEDISSRIKLNPLSEVFLLAAAGVPVGRSDVFLVEKSLDPDDDASPKNKFNVGK